MYSYFEKSVVDIFTIWLFNIAMEKSPRLIGKPSITGQFSMAMLNNQRVYIYTWNPLESDRDGYK